jgi:hypothetical protein
MFWYLDCSSKCYTLRVSFGATVVVFSRHRCRQGGRGLQMKASFVRLLRLTMPICWLSTQNPPHTAHETAGDHVADHIPFPYPFALLLGIEFA